MAGDSHTGAALSESDSGILWEAGIFASLWLDYETSDLVRAITSSVAHRHPDVRAVILYGSVARHEERPLDDPEPSDVDILLLFDLEAGLAQLPYERDLAISRSIGLARDLYLGTPREVQVMIAVRDLADWDPTFVANVARDGILLWARGPLPSPLASVASRLSLPLAL